MNLRSDNESIVAAEIMVALEQVNKGSAYAYGDDAVTQSLAERFNDFFEKDVFVLPVATGTAANSISIAQIAPSYGSVYCHETAHLYVDECGAPEFFSGGAKLLPIPGRDAKLDQAVLSQSIQQSGFHGEHECQISGVSLSQATELGTVYSLDEIKEISSVAHNNGLLVHMDGARFANAIVSLGCTPAEMTWKAGIDFLSFGATKNGAMAAEAVIVFDRDNSEQIVRRRKRGGHLFSKMRYLSIQLEAYLRNDLWRRLASNANGCATRLADGLSSVPGVKILHPVQVNEVFTELPEEVAKRLYDRGHEFHPWPGRPNVYRMICAHNTDLDEVDVFLSDARG